MRVYTEVVIDMTTLEVESSKSFNYEGQVALLKGGGGGGGASGTVDFPTYLKEVHADLLADGEPDGSGLTTINTSLVAVMNTALGVSGNPYTDASRPSGATAYNPATDLAAVMAEFSEYDTAVDALTDSATWGTFVDSVVAKIAASGTFPTPTFLNSLSSAISGILTAATTALASTPISDAVDAYEAEELSNFQRSVGRWAAGMADINAVQSSSFIIGLALREQDFENKVERFRREMKLETFKTIVLEGIKGHIDAAMRQQGIKDQMVLAGTAQVVDLLKHKLDNLRSAASVLAEIKRLAIVAEHEETNLNIELDAKEATWDLEVFGYAANLLASGSGGTSGTGKAPLSTGQSVMGGALAGASIGASFGPVGAGIGAAAGGLMGLFA